MEKLIFRACTRRLDVRIVAYTKECLRQSSHTELQYSNTPLLQHSNTPLNAMSRQSQLTLTTPRGRGFLNPIKGDLSDWQHIQPRNHYQYLPLLPLLHSYLAYLKGQIDL